MWDRRRQVRLALPMPLMVVGGAKSAQFVERVVTEQVGIGALSFQTESWALMPAGARVVVAFEVPADGRASGSPERIARVARVVRVERVNGAEASEARRVALELERSLHAAFDIDQNDLGGIELRPPP